LNERHKHVLVVDDDDSVREVIGSVLEQAGYRVTAASDGLSARTALQQGKYSAVLLDCLLPGNAASGIAGVAAQFGIPILLTSGHPDQIQHQGDQPLKFIAKPFRVGTLLDALASLELPAPTKTTPTKTT
jgi:CheY-like chemotaxis protein